jgi:trehalose 6-phosphate synthase/phosphatase
MHASFLPRRYHEGDLVWIHGFHLLVVPTLVSKAHAAAKIGVFLHTPFPSSEIFRTLTKREDILRGMLSADQVGFHLYEYARHFLTCCQRLLGLEWTHDAQGMTVQYGGRSVVITCIHAGMDQDVLRSVVAYPQVFFFPYILLAFQSHHSLL